MAFITVSAEIFASSGEVGFARGRGHAVVLRHLVETDVLGSVVNAKRTISVEQGSTAGVAVAMGSPGAPEALPDVGKCSKGEVTMFRAIAFAIGALLISQMAIADDRERLVGTWKVVSYANEFQDGRPRSAPYGQSPTGFIILTAEGRMMAIVEGEGRKLGSTDEERATLWRSMLSYSGLYRLEGDKWITKVDASWNPAWNGTEQVRFYKLDGNRLEVTGAWVPAPVLPGSPILRGVVVFERAK
jgi:hypothetical protein